MCKFMLQSEVYGVVKQLQFVMDAQLSGLWCVQHNSGINRR